MGLYERCLESAGAIKAASGGFAPDVALVLGSGLGPVAELVTDKKIVSYSDIPGFSRSTAPGHIGRLVLGRLGGKNVAVMQGRLHFYEGYSYAQTAYPVQVLKLLGARTLVVTNAAGGIDLSFAPGELMLITDHIKFFNDGPLRGENDDRLGTRFPDMSFTYAPELQALARACADALGMALREGVYAYFPGPQFETPAEIRALRALGAAAVGMSTVPEVIAAAHLRMRVLGLSLITNMGTGILPQPLSGEEVNAAAARAGGTFSRFILKCLERMEV